MVSCLVSHILVSALGAWCLVFVSGVRRWHTAWVTNSWLYQKSVTNKYGLPTRKSVG